MIFLPAKGKPPLLPPCIIKTRQPADSCKGFESKVVTPLVIQGLLALSGLLVLRDVAIRAGIKKHVTPHTLRHTCATHLLKGRADIRQIQKLLGHRRLSSTEVYTRVELSDLAEVIARCHPRERNRDR
jgi:integrase/recombinase XerD